MDALIRLKALLREQTDEWTKDEATIMKKRLTMPKNQNASILDSLGPNSPSVRADISIAKQIAASPFINIDDPTPRVDDLLDFDNDVFARDLITPRMEALIEDTNETPVSISGIRPPVVGRGRAVSEDLRKQFDSGVDLQTRMDQLRQAAAATDLERRNSLSSINTDERTRTLKGKSVSFVDDPDSPGSRPAAPPERNERRASISNIQIVPNNSSSTTTSNYNNYNNNSNNNNTGYNGILFQQPPPPPPQTPLPPLPSTSSNSNSNNSSSGSISFASGRGSGEEKPTIVRRQGSVSSMKSEQSAEGMKRSQSGLRRSVSEVQEAIPSVDDLEPVNNPKQAMQMCFGQMTASDWIDQRSGVDTLRRLTKYNAELVLDNMRDIWPLLIPLVDNLRSYLARLAIRCLNEMFLSFGSEMGTAIKLIAPMLLKKFAESNSFIKDEADQAIVCMIENAPPSRTLDALLNVSGDKAAVVRAQVAECLSIFAQIQMANVHDPKLLQRLSQTLQKYQGEGRNETRQSTKSAIGFIKQNLPPHLHKHMKEVLL